MLAYRSLQDSIRWVRASCTLWGLLLVLSCLSIPAWCPNADYVFKASFLVSANQIAVVTFMNQLQSALGLVGQYYSGRSGKKDLFSSNSRVERLFPTLSILDNTSLAKAVHRSGRTCHKVRQLLLSEEV